MGDDPAMTGEKSVELRRDAEGLALVGDGMTLRADFSRLLPRLRPDRLGRTRCFWRRRGLRSRCSSRTR